MKNVQELGPNIFEKAEFCPLSVETETEMRTDLPVSLEQIILA